MKPFTLNQIIEMKKLYLLEEVEVNLYKQLLRINLLPDTQYLVTGINEEEDKLYIEDVYGNQHVIYGGFKNVFLPSRESRNYYQFVPKKDRHVVLVKQFLLNKENYLEARHEFFTAFKRKDKYVLYTVSNRMVGSIKAEVFEQVFIEHHFGNESEIHHAEEEDILLSMMHLAVSLDDKEMFEEYSQKYSAVKQ